MSMTLVRKEDGVQKLVYFTSQALLEVKERYPPHGETHFYVGNSSMKA